MIEYNYQDMDLGVFSLNLWGERGLKEKFTESRLFLDGLLLFVCLFWGMAYIWSKQVTDLGMGPNAYLAVRYLTSALILIPFFWKKIRQTTKQELFQAVCLGLLVYAAMVTQLIGLRYTTVANSAFITAAYVAVVPFVSWAMFRQKPASRSLIAVVLCIAGLYVLNVGPGGLKINLGNAITLVCALCWSVQVPLMSYAGRTASTETLTVVPILVAGTLGAVVGAVRHEFVFTGTALHTLFWPVLLSILFPTIFSGTAQAYVQKHISPTRAAIIYTTESVFACLMSALLGLEGLTPQLLLGGGLIMGGVLLSELPIKNLFLRRNSP